MSVGLGIRRQGNKYVPVLEGHCPPPPRAEELPGFKPFINRLGAAVQLGGRFVDGQQLFVLLAQDYLRRPGRERLVFLADGAADESGHLNQARREGFGPWSRWGHTLEGGYNG